MNFLELAQETVREAGTSDSVLLADVTDPPDSHVADIIRWVVMAWTSLQLQSEWRFMHVETPLALSAGDASYDLRSEISDFRRIIPYTRPPGRRWIRLDDKNQVFFVPYRSWAGAIDILGVKPGKPRYFTVDPGDNLLVSPEPAEPHTLTFDYLRTPQVLAADEDVPLLPLEFHEIIVYRALMKYAGYDETAPQYQRCEREYRELHRQMCSEQLPQMSVRGA